MKPPRIRTTVVGSYPLPDWLARAPSQQALVDATRSVLANALGLLGISAPESM